MKTLYLRKALQTEFDLLDKCVSMLALPVWTISPDKGRAIEPKDQSVRNGRVLTYTARTTAWIPTKSTITGARSLLLLKRTKVKIRIYGWN